MTNCCLNHPFEKYARQIGSGRVKITNAWNHQLALIFQFPIYLEPTSQLPIYQVTIDPWFQIYIGNLEDEGRISLSLSSAFLVPKLFMAQIQNFDPLIMSYLPQIPHNSLGPNNFWLWFKLQTQGETRVPITNKNSKLVKFSLDISFLDYKIFGAIIVYSIFTHRKKTQLKVNCRWSLVWNQ